MEVTERQKERFEKELEAVMDIAYRYAYRLTGNTDEAMDLVQDASIQAYKHYDSFTQGTNFKAWLLRILTNKFFKDRQRKPKGVFLPLDSAEDGYLYKMISDASGDNGDPSVSVLSQIDGESINEAISWLPEEFRAACMLYFLQEMSYQEIAEILEVPIGTVRSRLHRGRQLLQKALWDVAVANGVVQGAGA